MVFSCSECNFTAQFSSALEMHYQLHHPTVKISEIKKIEEPSIKPKYMMFPDIFTKKSATSSGSIKTSSSKYKMLTRVTSTSSVFDKLRYKFSKTKTPVQQDIAMPLNFKKNLRDGDSSDGSSKEYHSLPIPNMSTLQAEPYLCHLCCFRSDRITVLDRHLLNDHKIGLNNLLQLVLAKTKDSVSENQKEVDNMCCNQPYYKLSKSNSQEGEFLIETVTPTVKVMRNVSVNTELKMHDLVGLNCDLENGRESPDKSKELPKEAEESDKEDLFHKMSSLHEYMSKFVESAVTIKNVLDSKYNSKCSLRDHNRNFGSSSSCCWHQRLPLQKNQRQNRSASDEISRYDELGLATKRLQNRLHIFVSGLKRRRPSATRLRRDLRP